MLSAVSHSPREAAFLLWCSGWPPVQAIQSTWLPSPTVVTKPVAQLTPPELHHRCFRTIAASSSAPFNCNLELQNSCFYNARFCDNLNISVCNFFTWITPKHCLSVLAPFPYSFPSEKLVRIWVCLLQSKGL